MTHSALDKVNLARKFSLFSETWRPKIVAELNDTYVVLIEPKSTLNTGNVRSERTVAKLDRI